MLPKIKISWPFSEILILKLWMKPEFCIFIHYSNNVSVDGLKPCIVNNWNLSYFLSSSNPSFQICFSSAKSYSGNPVSWYYRDIPLFNLSIYNFANKKGMFQTCSPLLGNSVSEHLQEDLGDLYVISLLL